MENTSIVVDAVKLTADGGNLPLTTAKVGGGFVGLSWVFSETTSAGATEKQIRFNNSSSPSKIYVSHTAADGTAAQNLLNALATGGSVDNIALATITLKYEHLRAGTKPNVFAKIKATKVETGYHELDIVVLASTGLFKEGDEVVVALTMTGDTGPQGIPGSKAHDYVVQLSAPGAPPRETTVQVIAHREFTITGILASAKAVPENGSITIGFDAGSGATVLSIDKAGVLTPPANWTPINVKQGTGMAVALAPPFGGWDTTARDIVFYIMGEVTP